MEYPINEFSPWFKDMVESVSNVKKTPIALAANFGLSIVSSIISSRVYVVRKDGSTVSTTLWTMTLMASGEGKSPVFSNMIEPLRSTSIENNLIENISSAAFFRKLNALKKIVMLSAEGTFFDNIRRKNNFITPLIQAYDEESILYDRGNVEIKVDKPSLTVGIAIQNERLYQLQSERCFKELHTTGLIDRFLVSIPKSMLGKRTFDNTMIPLKVEELYTHCIKMLDNMFSKNISYVYLSDEASNIFIKWCNERENDYNEKKYKSIHQWLGKREGFLLRLAGCLHMIELLQDELEGYIFDDPLSDKYTITDSQLKNAIKLLEYYQEERLKLENLSSFEDEASQKLWDYIKKRKITEIKKRDLAHGVSGTTGLKNKHEFNNALDILVKKGLVEIREEKTKGSISTMIYVNNCTK